MYVIRRDDGSRKRWLTRETPKLAWGDRESAKVYSSAFLAQRTITRLGAGRFTMERNVAPGALDHIMAAPKAALEKIEEAVASAIAPDEAKVPPG